METSCIVAVATISQSLATFIKQELSETNVAVQLLTDPELFFKRLKSIKPELILLDASYPTGEKSASLAKTLQQDLSWQDIPLVVVKTFFEPLDESFPEIDPENILTQPFTRSDLLTVLQRVIPQAINNHKQDQDTTMIDADDKAKAAAQDTDQENIIELTEVVEEGLPLEQLPPLALNAAENSKPIMVAESDIPGGNESEEMEFPSDEAIDELDFTAAKTVDMTSSQEGTQAEHQPTNEVQEKTVPGQELDDALNFSEPAIIKTPAVEPAEVAENLKKDGLKAEPETAKGLSEAATTTESPEDYLVPDEEEQKSDSLPPPETAEIPPATAETETARPSVVTEAPETTDFSRQIEGLTQEWSKKMLVSTYASMDKLIQALGEMAPTIVEQVAREIIPPLAEKIIKAEIKRLEEKIEDEHT